MVYWDLLVGAVLYGIGFAFFAPFEARTPIGRRILKLGSVYGPAVFLSWRFGPAVSLSFILAMFAPGAGLSCLVDPQARHCLHAPGAALQVLPAPPLASGGTPDKRHFTPLIFFAERQVLLEPIANSMNSKVPYKEVGLCSVRR